MPINNHAAIRYEVLDQCFSDFYHQYGFEDLIKACDQVLSEIDPNTNGVSTKTLRNDIRFMRSEHGYNAPIEVYRDAEHPYYRYSDKNFSIRKRPMTSSEAKNMIDAVTLLRRFSGLPNMNWLDDMVHRLESEFHLNNCNKAIVGFDHNTDFNGSVFYEPILEAIVGRYNIEIKYQSFQFPEETIVMSPYFLKQYNNRWYVLGFVKGRDYIPNYCLDRIKKIRKSKTPFVEKDIDFENDFFQDIVGVTHPSGKKKEKVLLQVEEDYVPYFTSLPIHDSLKRSHKQLCLNCFTLDVIVNYELITYLVSHADKVKVISPCHLKKEVLSRLKMAINLQLKD